MKRSALWALVLCLPLISTAGEVDVNRDGRIDQGDAKALARMVAGLDPVDLRYDQNGDGALTLDDVNHVLNSIPPERTYTSDAAPQLPPAGAGNIAFYAVKQKSGGRCVVVAGDEGISPGDTLFGVYATFQAAQDQLGAQCSPGAAIPPSSHRPPQPRVFTGPALTTDRLYRPDTTVERGRWGTVTHIGEDPNLRTTVKEKGVTLEDGFFVSPGHGGDSEIHWAHDGSDVTLSGTATVIDCLHYCGRAGSIEFSINGDGRELWNSGLVLQNGPAKPFSVSLNGIGKIRLIAGDGGNGVNEDWGGWLNLAVAPSGGPAAATESATASQSVTGGTPATLAIPIFDGDDTTRSVFVIATENGRARIVDRIRRSSAEVRSRAFHDNVFKALGRSLGSPACQGQIVAGPIRKGNGAVHALLLADTTTGAMGYVVGLGDDPTKARLKKIADLPAQAIAAGDGNFILVMRRDGSGKTVGAYLHHGTTGKCLYFRGLDDLETHISPTPVSGLPASDGKVSGLALFGGSDATTHFLLIDNERGTMSLVGGVKKRAAQLTVQPLNRNLVSSFPTDTPVSTPIRFVPIPITTRSGSTDSALIVDVASGSMAILEHLTKPSKTRLIGVNRSIYGLLPANVDQPRSISAVPKVDDSGMTIGAWLFDSATSEVLFVDNLQNPNTLELRMVTKEK